MFGNMLITLNIKTNVQIISVLSGMLLIGKKLTNYTTLQNNLTVFTRVWNFNSFPDSFFIKMIEKFLIFIYHFKEIL